MSFDIRDARIFMLLVGVPRCPCSSGDGFCRWCYPPRLTAADSAPSAPITRWTAAWVDRRNCGGWRRHLEAWLHRTTDGGDEPRRDGGWQSGERGQSESTQRRGGNGRRQRHTAIGREIVWLTPVYPVGSINSNGLAATAPVYADTAACVTGVFLGVTGSESFWCDSNPDNYGIYAGDQIPDSWQVRYFGVDNPLGVAGATNCNGQNNLCAYTADLNPTNPTSLFCIEAISKRRSKPPGMLQFLHRAGVHVDPWHEHGQRRLDQRDCANGIPGAGL